MSVLDETWSIAEEDVKEFSVRTRRAGDIVTASSVRSILRPITDPDGHRAKLAAAAPEMARLLLKLGKSGLTSSHIDARDGKMIDAVLAKAGVNGQSNGEDT